jgi:NADH-quinone oxidoreductase subunit M
MNGPTNPAVAAMKDLRPREILAVAPLLALIVFVGVYPKPVLDLINPAVTSTMSQVHEVDPTPAHPYTGYTNVAQNGVAP